MIPIYLDPANARIALIGRGVLATRRLARLRDAGAAPEVWSDAPSSELAEAADNLIHRLPRSIELNGYHAIWIADLSRPEAEQIAGAARASNILVNVEDVVDLCDFHTPAVVRRGKLTLAAATGGASPAVARAAREQLEQAFPTGWGEALDDISRARKALRGQGADGEALAADARKRLHQHGLI